MGDDRISSERFYLHPDRSSTARSAPPFVWPFDPAAHLVRYADQPGGDRRPSPVGFSGGLFAPFAVQNNSRSRSLSGMAARRSRGLDWDARRRLFGSGVGPAAER